MTLLSVGPLPQDALAAAGQFHANMLPAIVEALQSTSAPHFTLVFAPADHTHRNWRLAVVQGLAREHAPLRVNAVESDDDVAIAAAAAYLAGADGVTGQFLPLDGAGAGKVV
jgi:hypothetical protein